MWDILCAKVFPFHSMTGVELRRNNLSQTSDERLFNIYEKCDQFEFEPFGIADYNRSDFELFIMMSFLVVNIIRKHSL